MPNYTVDLMGSLACWLMYHRFGKEYVLCVIKKSGKSSGCMVFWLEGWTVWKKGRKI
jgi:hypothetical protein